MTREQVRSIFADATDDQVNQLLNIHSADINKAKSSGDKLQADLDSVKNELATAKATISQLEASKGDVEALQKQIESTRLWTRNAPRMPPLRKPNWRNASELL